MKLESENFSVIEQYDPDANPVDRQERIDWWDQSRLREAKLMVAGSGAIGNETLKNLALMGFRHVFVVDFDEIEPSNLSRAVLFRQEDVGKRKVEVAAHRVKELAVDPEFHVEWYHGDLIQDLGPSIYAEMDIVLGCLDNVGARIAIDRCCRLVGIPWIDAGINELGLSVSFFDPKSPVSYESTLSKEAVQNANKRNSCFGFKTKAAKEGRVATTQIAGTLVSGLQVQETVKYLCGKEVPVGKRLFFQGITNQLDIFGYPTRGEAPVEVVKPKAALPLSSQSTVREVLEAASGPEHSGEGCRLEILHTTFIESFVLETGVEITVNRAIFTLTHEEIEALFAEHHAELGKTGYRENSVQSIDLSASDTLLEMNIRALGFPYGPYLAITSEGSAEIDYYSLALDKVTALREAVSPSLSH